MKRTRILNQYRTEEGRKHWKEYAAGSREYGTRYNLMAFSCRADLKTTAVMAGGGISITYWKCMRRIVAYLTDGRKCSPAYRGGRTRLNV